MTGIMIDRFWEDGRTPSRSDALQSNVRNGSRLSIDSWMRNGLRGSSSWFSKDLGGEERMRRRSSGAETPVSSVREWLVGVNVGSGDCAVCWRMDAIFASYASAEKGAV